MRERSQPPGLASSAWRIPIQIVGTPAETVTCSDSNASRMDETTVFAKFSANRSMAFDSWVRNRLASPVAAPETRSYSSRNTSDWFSQRILLSRVSRNSSFMTTWNAYRVASC